MRLTIIRRTVKTSEGIKTMYSVGTPFCIWSGIDSFGRYIWREFDLPDKDGIHIFNLIEFVEL